MLPVGGEPLVKLQREQFGLSKALDPTTYRISVPDMNSNVMACEKIGCIAYTPHRKYSVMLTSYAILFKDSWGGQGYTKGQSFLLSPANDAMVVWDKHNLKIHSLYSRGYREDFEDVELYVYTQTRLDLYRGDGLLRQAAWSINGRYLAYSDSQGLWLWDLPDREQPPKLLLLAGDHVPYAQYFSPGGRYLTISQGQRKFTLDLQTMRRLPDGIVSPDDNYLMTFWVDNAWPRPAGCWLSEETCNPPSLNAEYEIVQISWLDERTYWYVICREGKTNCQVRSGTLMQYPGVAHGPGLAYAHEPFSGKVVILREAKTIVIDGQERDLSAYLDGDIISVQWLPTLLNFMIQQTDCDPEVSLNCPRGG
jgi:hypothetical protein